MISSGLYIVRSSMPVSVRKASMLARYVDGSTRFGRRVRQYPPVGAYRSRVASLMSGHVRASLAAIIHRSCSEWFSRTSACSRTLRVFSRSVSARMSEGYA
jgi:hypothetical protein